MDKAAGDTDGKVLDGALGRGVGAGLGREAVVGGIPETFGAEGIGFAGPGLKRSTSGSGSGCGSGLGVGRFLRAGLTYA